MPTVLYPMTRRWLVLAVLALPLIACGKKAGLRLPETDEGSAAGSTDTRGSSRDPETVEEETD